jgi:hypothetical protein
MTTLGDGQFVDRATFPEVIVNRSSQVSDTGGARSVFANIHADIAASRGWIKRDGRIDASVRGLLGRDFELIDDGCEAASGNRWEGR